MTGWIPGVYLLDTDSHYQYHSTINQVSSNQSTLQTSRNFSVHLTMESHASLKSSCVASLEAVSCYRLVAIARCDHTVHNVFTRSYYMALNASRVKDTIRLCDEQ